MRVGGTVGGSLVEVTNCLTCSGEKSATCVCCSGVGTDSTVSSSDGHNQTSILLHLTSLPFRLFLYLLILQFSAPESENSKSLNNLFRLAALLAGYSGDWFIRVAEHTLRRVDTHLKDWLVEIHCSAGAIVFVSMNIFCTLSMHCRCRCPMPLDVHPSILMTPRSHML